MPNGENGGGWFILIAICIWFCVGALILHIHGFVGGEEYL